MKIWHRLLGLTLTDLFTNTCYEVEMEKDVSVQQQFLDIVIVRRVGSGLPEPTPEELPDGFESLSAHNLITFKSLYEPLDRFALIELGGHMVAYAKSVAGDAWREFCDREIGLFALCVRQPSTAEVAQGLISTASPDVKIWPGGGFPVHCVILGQAPATENNAIWNLFSANPRIIQYGQEHYHWKKPGLSTIVREIANEYLPLGLDMPYTVEDYLTEQKEKLRKEVLENMTPKEKLEGLTPDELVKGLSPEVLRALLERLESEQS